MFNITTMLWHEAIVSPEAQQYLGKRHASIMKLKDWTRKLVWDRLPRQDECETYIERDLTPEEQDLINRISPGNVCKIQAILSNYY